MKTAEEIVAEIKERIRKESQERAFDAQCNDLVHVIAIVTLQRLQHWIETEDTI